MNEQLKVKKQNNEVDPQSTVVYATWLVKPDVDCYLNLNGSYYGALKGGEYNKVGLKKGANVLEFKRSASGVVVKEEIVAVENTDQGLLKVTLGASENGRTMNKMTTVKEIEMVLVEGGRFTMGCTSEQSDCRSDEKPTHQVTLSSYYIGKYEVTQAEWESVMGNNPSSFKCASCPVERVSWNDVQVFISELNNKSGKRYRLPTEAEWEYAARGGTKRQGYKYSGSHDLYSVSWNTDNSGAKTHPLGQKSPNELGIYDMSGNVWEWCSDWKGAYSSGSQTNPQGASSGSDRVLRGGSWYDHARLCRVTFRYFDSPVNRLNNYGFRLVLVP